MPPEFIVIVRSKEESSQVQRFLFKLNHHWLSDPVGKYFHPFHLEHRTYCIHSDYGTLTWSGGLGATRNSKEPVYDGLNELIRALNPTTINELVASC